MNHSRSQPQIAQSAAGAGGPPEPITIGINDDEGVDPDRAGHESARSGEAPGPRWSRRRGARIVAAGHEERRRLERDLHDGAQQRLVGIGLELRNAQFQLGDSRVVETIDHAVEQITIAIADLRGLAAGIRPACLDHGLDVALYELARRAALPVELRAGPERFPADIEATAYFVACEALTNAVKHSAATGVEVHTEHVAGHLVVTVRDNGMGGARASQGTGLRGLSDRVAAVGGRMTVESRHGCGTTLVAELPCVS